MHKLRRKFLFYAVMACGCLCETVGCPQLLGNAIRDGSRTFLDGGLITLLLNSANLQDILGLPAGP